METPRRVDAGRYTRLLAVIGATSTVTLVGLVLAWAAYMRRYVLHDIPQTPALSGDVQYFDSAAGRLGYYVSRHHRTIGPIQTGDGTAPILFIHSVNAAASSYEMRPLYEHYAQQRTVYALDLPGFGLSERGDRPYTPKLYRDVINDFIGSQIPAAPVDAVALSLGCEFMCAAALRQPEQFRSLTLISPTGLMGASQSSGMGDAMLRLLLKPQWRRLLFDTLTSRPSLRYFLSRLQTKLLDKGLLHYAYVSSHRPDAEYAPYYFISGKLFSSSILQDYMALTLPVLAMIPGNAKRRYQNLELLRRRPNWQIVELTDYSELPHFDDPKRVIGAIDQHWQHIKP